ncbi:hypothetical protein LEMLEM_LOCUS2055 [Lemmus lemmus]
MFVFKRKLLFALLYTLLNYMAVSDDSVPRQLLCVPIRKVSHVNSASENFLILTPTQQAFKEMC